MYDFLGSQDKVQKLAFIALGRHFFLTFLPQFSKFPVFFVETPFLN